MNIPTLPKNWKVEERCAYLKRGDGSAYMTPYRCQVVLNPKGKVALLFFPRYNALYEESSIDVITEFEFTRDGYTWEQK